MAVTEAEPVAAPTRRALVVANRKAAQVEEALEAGLAALREHGFECIREAPADPAALVEMVRDARSRYDVVVLAGGDGTLNTALPALRGAGAATGILPLGTANDLARTLGLPLEPAAAAHVIATGQVQRIDVGRVNDHYFFNVAHVGVGARARRRLTAERKRRWRALSYPVALFQALREYRPFRVRIDIDGRRRWLLAMHVAVGNGRYSGGGVPIEGDAGIADTLFDVYCIRAVGPAALLRAGGAIWRGEPGPRSLWRASGRHIELHTRRPRTVTADGEELTRTPAIFDVEPGAVSVIIPEEGQANVS